MTDLPGLPDWAAWPVALLLLLGSSITLIGSVGLLRLQGFYRRVHAPTLGTTAGMAADPACLDALFHGAWFPHRRA